MAKLFPFRAYRYDIDRTGELSSLVTQPYDKISDELLEIYRSRSPYNISRVIKNTDYRAAGRTFHEWVSEGILKRDEEPALYPYQQVFEHRGEERSRLGFIGLVSLEDSEIAVRGHEKVLEGPLADRLHLIRETRSNDGLIFTLFSDPGLKIDRLLSECCAAAPPVAEAADDFGVLNRLWKIHDRELQDEIRLLFQAFPLYIADGHHRFETARIYAGECRSKGWQPAAPESFDKRMMAFFNMDAPGLEILPTHRALRNLPNSVPGELLGRLERWFDIRRHPTLEDLRVNMRGEGHRFGIVLAAPLRLYSIHLREAPSRFLPDLPGPARALDVNILHRGILQPILGIGEKELAQQSHVDYYRSELEMIEQVRAGCYPVAFILNPTRLDQVRDVSEAGLKMPQKSTDFFPKLLTGLLFMKMEITGTGEGS